MMGKQDLRGGSGPIRGASLLASFLHTLSAGGTTHCPTGGAQEIEEKTKRIKTHRLKLSSPVYSLALALVFFLTLGFSEAATYYVATNGNDGNTCAAAQNSSTAKLTIAQGITCLSSGDTLIIKGGTYNEGLYDPPSGKSSAEMTTVKGAPGETVIIKPDRAEVIMALDDPRSYISIENLTVDGNNKSSGYGVWLTAWHTRFKDLEFRQIGGIVFAVYKGDGNPEGSGSNEFTSIRIHDSGDACDSAYPDVCLATHGFYVSTSDNLFDGVVVDGVPGHGITIYDANNSRKVGNIIRDSVFRNNGVGVSIFAGDDTVVENNLFENNTNPEFGTSIAIWVGGGSANTIIRNNTLLGTNDIFIDQSATGTQIID
jgi:hypothetical protein